MFAALLIVPAASTAQDIDPSAVYSPSGADILRPAHRIDLRAEYASSPGEDALASTVRYEHPFPVTVRSQVNFRLDVPFVHSAVEELGATAHQSGLGDILVQAIFVRRLTDTQGFGVGTQIILPTARKDTLGKGKWRIRPTAGYRWSVDLTPGSFFQLIGRYDFSVAGKNSRSHVRELQLAPNLEIELPGEAYVSIFPSADVRYNFVKHWFFFPANIEVGKSWGRIVGSMEAAAALINRDEGPYRWKIQSRVGFRF